MSKSITDQLKDLVELDSDRFRLTHWEVDFVDSCERQVRDGKELSAKQKQAIDALWDTAFIHGKREQR